MPPFPVYHRPLSLTHLYNRQQDLPALLLRAGPGSSVESSPSATANGLSASDLILEAEEHWNVSARSILAAWGLTAAGAIIIILLYSLARPRWKLIYLPRIKIRKPSRTPKEKAEEKHMLAEMDENERKKYLERKERNKPDYYPEGKNNEGQWIARAPKSEKGFFGWLTPTLGEVAIECKSAMPKFLFSMWTGRSKNIDEKATTEPGSGVFEQDLKLLHMLGLDAMVYLLFLRLLKYLFSAMSVLAGLLAITNYYLNTQTTYGSMSTISPSGSEDDMTKRDSPSSSSSETSSNNTSIIDNPQLLTAANVTSNGLLVHISFEWIATMMIIVFVLKTSAHHLKLVQEWTHLNYNEVSFKTLMITNLSLRQNKAKSLVTVADAKREIKSLVLGSERGKIDASVWFAMHNMNPLHEKMETFKKKHYNWAIKAVAMETFHGRGEGVFYDSCTGRVCGRSKSASSRVDGALKEKLEIEELQDRIRQGQVDVRHKDLSDTITSAFVTVPSAKQAREILKNVKDDMKRAGYHIQRAPRSHNVLWKNLEKDVKSRHSHAIIGKFALVVICFVNTIPLMIVTVLANLDTAIDHWPTLAKLEESSEIWKAIFTVLAGVLPATISAMFSYVLPYIMRRLSRWSGALTRGQLDKAVIRQLFIFQLVSNFIVFSLLGVVYETYLTISEDVGKESWSTIYASLGDVPAKVTRAYISESLYWLSWYPIRSVVACLQLLQIPRLILKTPQLLMIKTPHDLAEVAQPENFEYAIEYSHVLFAMVVGLMYAPLAPIVVICAAIYFWTLYIIHNNQLKFVFDSKETDGKCWKILVNRVLIATVFMQMFMVLNQPLAVTLKTQSAVMAVGAGLPIGIIFLFKMYLRRHYHPDGEVFSQYIDKYEDDDIRHGEWAPEYEHELLREDWMPKIKTVKNAKLMSVATREFPKLKELLRVDRKADSDKSRGLMTKKRRNRVREKG
ncbi:hypothetical protein C356_00994 [Cryptococcus neoformans c45]|nr:hypothetical protein C356_00994 [Cryptococcus neoformans var. grubii c45]